MSRQAEVEKVLREELWTHPDSAIEGFTRAAARIDALYNAPADGCEGCIHLSHGRPDVECHPCKRYPHKYPDHYTPKEGDTA